MPHRACDKCYSVKARCVYSSESAKCERCARLGHVCVTQRAILPSGRPRTTSSPRRFPVQAVRAQPSENECSDVVIWTSEPQKIPIFKSFTTDELALVSFLLHPQQIASLIYGETFRDQLRSSLTRLLFTATDELKDGYIALAKALSDNKNIPLGNREPFSDTERGSKALQRLGNLRTTSLDGARIALALALALVTYNDLHVGAQALPISQSALLQAAPWRDQLLCGTIEDTDPNITCLLFNEMFECLVHAQIPVFRCEPKQDMFIDRYYGICHELLPYLYDICVLHNSIKYSSMSHDDILQPLAITSWFIEQWSPESAVDRRRGIVMDEVENHHVLLQAKAFKAAAQLLVLQMQKPHVVKELIHLKVVQLETQIKEAIYHGVNRPKYMLFPYFLVCLELYNMEAEVPSVVQKAVEELSNGIAPKSSQSMLACLRHICKNRKLNPSLTWFECISPGYSFAMGP